VSTIGFCLEMLAVCPNIQKRVFEEDKLIQENLKGREMTYEDLNQYEYLERVITETHRIFPVAPLIARRLSEDTYFGKTETETHRDRQKRTATDRDR